MAYIGHRCNCGHTDLQHVHDGTETSLGGCTAGAGASCGRPCGPVQEPEIIPTFDLKGRPVDRVIEPGGGLASETGVLIVRTCTCDACTALYERAA